MSEKLQEIHGHERVGLVRLNLWNNKHFNNIFSRFIIIHRTRPLIGLPNPEEELRVLEEKANATYGVYKEQLDTKARLLEENKVIEDEKKALLKQIEKEQGKP